MYQVISKEFGHLDLSYVKRVWETYNAQYSSLAGDSTESLGCGDGVLFTAKIQTLLSFTSVQKFKHRLDLRN